MATPNGIEVDEEGVARCWWCTETDAYRDYHDDEWGRPVGSDRRIYEKICLEGFQAGLSWRTILEKRDAFRSAFEGFEIERVASYDADDVERLLDNEAIVRHRGKIESAIGNARRAIRLVERVGSLARFVWHFEPAEQSRPETVTRPYLESQTESEASRNLADALAERGWTYVGPTTMHSLLRAIGIVNAHVEGCDRRPECADERAAFERPPPL